MSKNNVLNKSDSHSAPFERLNHAILNRTAKIGIFGMGYVGLPLARALNIQNYEVIGFDTDLAKIDSLKQGKSYIKSLTNQHIQDLNTSQKFFPTNTPNDIEKMDVILICVPTPLTKNREPDMSYVISALNMINAQDCRGKLIILESTTYPGTTRELLKPAFEKKGLVLGETLFLAYSPEREDPGNCVYETSSIPKVVGADDSYSRQLAVSLYTQFVPKVIEVSNSDTAEAVKLTENIFRFVNIGLVNELKIIYDRMGIDIWEVMDAAKTKPFGFMPFYPGPGLGGHCIPIDPFYLTWKAREYGIATQYIELSGQINNHMAHYVIERLREELDSRLKKGLNGSRILLIGLSYKKNVNDLRESPSLIIMESLTRKSSLVDYYDSHISIIPKLHEHPSFEKLESIRLTQETLKSYDAVVICTDHDNVDYDFIVQNSKIVIDTRNATKDVIDTRNIIVKA